MLDSLFYICYIAGRNNRGHFDTESNNKGVVIGFATLLSVQFGMLFSVVFLQVVRKFLQENIFEDNFIYLFSLPAFIAGYAIFRMICKRYTNERIEKIETLRKQQLSLGTARLIFAFIFILWWILLMTFAFIIIDIG